MVWTRLPFIRACQNHLAGHSERGKKTKQTAEEVGRIFREWTGLENREKWRKVDSGEQRKMEESRQWRTEKDGGK